MPPHDVEKGESDRESSTKSERLLDGADMAEKVNDAEKEASAPVQPLQFDGPDDPDDPLNWSMAKKALHIYVLCELGMATTVGVSSFAPAIDNLAEDFHLSKVVATLPLTLYVMGQALGPCLAAPLSETYGRKGVFLLTTPFGLVFALGAGFSQNIASLCILRFFAGLFASPSLSVGGGIIADIVMPINRATITAIWISMALGGTALGPVFAGYAVEHKGWRWTQWIFIFVILAGFVPSLFTSESYKKVLLARRAKKRGLAPPPDPMSKGDAWQRTKFFLTITLFRPFAMLFVEPIVAFLSIYLAVVFIILFSFFDAFPIVFAGVYGFSLGETGLSFFGLFIGVQLGLVLYVWVDRLTFHRHAKKQQTHTELPPLSPEHLLYPAMYGAFLLTASMFWFGWTSRASVHWISAELATVVLGVAIVGLSAPLMQYLLQAYGALYGASAVGANNLLRYAAGGVAPLFTNQMYDALGIGWAVSLIAFVSVVLLPIPFVLFKYGPQIRARSRYNPNPK